ncbi:Aste57867_12683 [Aphanomyces stellatus]|uniref:Aste57867_12683 protein n=1 Tax=Aphanomyces stellatus TaxID=120398 RepID=A0A485KWK4_9STRA|nr:hypothetical protein As57867_012636 [Aphanomyces stellatus]VFT89533.1 Aste57867_12683 [Aphanomyces stellatus]
MAYRLLMLGTTIVLGLLVWLNFVYDGSAPPPHHPLVGAAFLNSTFSMHHDPTFRPMMASNATREDEVCRVQFVFAGPKYDYQRFSVLQTWVRYADPKCTIEFIRTSHPMFQQLTPAERHVFLGSAYVPILQADFMKLLVLYYLGGLVTDLDIEALKPFPDQWTGPTTPLATCDVVLGIEGNCYDGNNCNMVRKGQIQNWSTWSRRRHSPFVGQLIEYAVAKFNNFPGAPVQEVFGSGAITDFVRLYGGFVDVPHYQAATNARGATLQKDLKSVLRIQKEGEEVCVVGFKWTGGECSGQSCLLHHLYEGSWKGDGRPSWWSRFKAAVVG